MPFSHGSRRDPCGSLSLGDRVENRAYSDSLSDRDHQRHLDVVPDRGRASSQRPRRWALRHVWWRQRCCSRVGCSREELESNHHRVCHCLALHGDRIGVLAVAMTEWLSTVPR